MSTKSNSKIPLRGIAALFNQLDPGVKSQLQSAFAEAEDLMDYHSRSAVDKQQRRSLSSLVDAPVLSHETNNRGFDVHWARLTDRRIQNYQVQVSFDSTFPNPDTYNVVDTCFALEGLGTTVFVRVRAVRFNGECGPWSDVEEINAFATSAGPIVYTRGFDDVSSFYTSNPTLAFPGPIQHITITPQRQNGGIVVFGSISVADPAFTAGDFIKVKLNSTTLSEIDLDTLVGVDRPFSMGFGPTFLTHEAFGFSAADDLNPATATQSGIGLGTFTGWTNLANATGVMETDFSGAAATDYLQTGLAAGQALNSKHLKLSNFGFTVAGTSTITGVEITFTGAWLGGDPAKSNPQIATISLIDGGVSRSYSHSTTFPWPGDGTVPASGLIESVTFGGPTDLWGENPGFWTPAKVNSATFGVDVVARMLRKFNDTPGNCQVFLYGMIMTVFSINANFEANVDVFFFEQSGAGTLLGCTINAIEFGQSIS